MIFSHSSGEVEQMAVKSPWNAVERFKVITTKIPAMGNNLIYIQIYQLKDWKILWKRNKWFGGKIEMCSLTHCKY